MGSDLGGRQTPIDRFDAGPMVAAAQSLVGQVVTSIRYTGLDYPDAAGDIAWDFGVWHWPEVGVEIRTSSGRVYTAIWDAPPQFILHFSEQPMSELWAGSSDQTDGRSWDVSNHERWIPFIDQQVIECDVGHARIDERSGMLPVAVRLASATGTAWIAAIAPGDMDPVTAAISSSTAQVGADEVIVLFDDDLASVMGL